ncbi:response regulator [Microbacterium sp. NPDC057944]|uniref:response regulator n=1 Tax=Microbacterium sp. NPDC057944 TaxID=3346286 RepID=UPI0036D7AEB9
MDSAWTRRVLIVEDQGALRTLVQDLFARQGFATAGAGSALEALGLFDDFDPDVLVADVDLGTRPDGAELAGMLRAKAPHLAVVFLSSYPRGAAGAVAFGIPGAVFVGKAGLASPDELVGAVERALRTTGEDSASDVAPPLGLGALTRHQLDVLGMISRGWSNEQIAEQSGATVRAVERSVSRIFERLGVTGDRTINPRVAAAARYIGEFGPVR